MTLIAALPMYDWPELRAETDAAWAEMRVRFLAQGIDAPESLVRRNADMPPVPGGIRDEAGSVIAPDPATLDPISLDLAVLWRHPNLLVSQTCWGPMELGLEDHVEVIGQGNYDGITGGVGAFYSSALIARIGEGGDDVAPCEEGEAILPLGFFSQKRLAFNEHRSLSGYLSLKRDLQAAGRGLDMFRELVETGSHRASVIAVAHGDADIAAIDCKSWMIAQRYEPAAAGLHVFGWTARRRGLPFIRAKGMDIKIAM